MPASSMTKTVLLSSTSRPRFQRSSQEESVRLSMPASLSRPSDALPASAPPTTRYPASSHASRAAFIIVVLPAPARPTTAAMRAGPAMHSMAAFCSSDSRPCRPKSLRAPPWKRHAFPCPTATSPVAPSSLPAGSSPVSNSAPALSPVANSIVSRCSRSTSGFRMMRNISCWKTAGSST